MHRQRQNYGEFHVTKTIPQSFTNLKKPVVPNANPVRMEGSNREPAFRRECCVNENIVNNIEVFNTLHRTMEGAFVCLCVCVLYEQQNLPFVVSALLTKRENRTLPNA